MSSVVTGHHVEGADKHSFLGRRENVRKVFNLPNLLGAVAFIAVFILPAGFFEAGMYISALTCAGVGYACAYLSMKEDGQIK
nr:MAG TPA: hypothetical protein [Caudoviricetes sp.]